MTESDTKRREFLVGAALVGIGAFARPALPAGEQNSYQLVLRDSAGREHVDDRFRYDVPTNTFWIEDAQVRFGSRDSGSVAPDFEFDIGARKLATRSILCHEVGDSVDIGGGRTGPNDAAPYTEPQTTEPNARLVRFWGRSWVDAFRPGSDERIGWDGGIDGENFAICGEMTVQADGEQTPISRPGRVVLRSTRPNEHSPRDGLIVSRQQQLCAADDGSPQAPSWTFRDQETGHSRTELGDGRVFLNASISGQRVADFRAPIGTDTSVALAYIGDSGEVRFEAVEIGEPDSGGPGHRMLRIAN